MVVMGRLGAPFGVRGWIKVQTYTEALDGLLDYPVWWVGREGEWREMEVTEAAVHGKGLVARLDRIAGREGAAQLKGLQVAVPRSRLPQTRNEFYWADLIGLKVVNLRGEDLGVVRGLLATGANDVLEVQGERERLIPVIEQVVVEVDLAAGRIRVDWAADY